MDPPVYAEKVDDKKETSDPITGLGPDIDEKHASESALPAELISAGSEHLHRRLGGKEIQLFAVGGAIGTCMESSNTLKGALYSDPFPHGLEVQNTNVEFAL